MSVDVVIAGGGPNGLMLACELSLAGVRPVLLERLPEPGDEPRANGLVGEVVRVLDGRGLYRRFTGASEPPAPVPFFMFGGMLLDLSALDPGPLHTLPIPQRRLEQLLQERALELGVEIRRGHELVDMSQDEDGVTVDVHAPDGDYELRARYLVGCDGAHSLVRKKAGIGFPGVTTEDVVSRSAHAALPASLLDPATGELLLAGERWRPFMIHRTAHGVFALASFEPGVHLITTMEWGREQVDERVPMTLEELRDSVRRVLGADLPMSPPGGRGPHVLRRLTGGNTRLADRYRAGRVLVAGDAAHVHSAAGGPGLNLGLQDVVNLGWKLAAEVHGWAPPGLLDTYHDERHPVGERVVMHTQAQSALLAPGGEVTALRTLFAELLDHDENRRRVAELIAGSDIRYDIRYDMAGVGTPSGTAGGDVRPDTGHPGTGGPGTGGLGTGGLGTAGSGVRPGAAGTGPAPHALLGGLAPELSLATDAGTTRLADLTHGARPLLLDLGGGNALAETAAGWKDRVDLVTAVTAVPDRRVPAGLLVRPDGYVAWTAPDEGTGVPADHGLREALSTWFGAPA
ncbi:FAD-dependent monooxygenase [Streptosporangium sp. G12]